MIQSTPRQRPLTDRERYLVAAALKAKYDAGASIRSIARDTCRSHSAVHRLLRDAGTTFRPKGARRKQAPA
ncbi:helix-turn-helix domain-containing protein [Streptomyces sp. NPDC056069]|uniref:helix-turn-helix domain-containing protein n=1 Tax=Streptomyces sp. NPDC056069 TaxID=3345702 RepID=UPI0035DB8751